MSETETRERCGYTVTDNEGIEQPCDRPATGWRWYEYVEHEPCLDAACSTHENVGGNRLHAAEAELSRLRGVVEAVQALADEWDANGVAARASAEARQGLSDERDLRIHAGKMRLRAQELRAVLAPVSSSGEAESGEAHPQFSAFRQRVLADPEARAAYDEAMARDAAPVPSGGQADGEGEQVKRAIRTLLPGLRVANYSERWAAASPAVKALTILCEYVGQPVDTAGDLVDPHVPTMHDRPLAARPVLSREALAEVLAKHRPIVGRSGNLNPVVGCSCLDRVFVAGQENYPDHLADVLTAGGEQRG